MSGYYNPTMNKATEVQRFAAVFGLNWDLIFYGAQMECEQRRTSLRKPQDMPLGQDVQQYVVKQMGIMLEAQYELFDLHQFVLLRNLVVA